MTKIKKVLIANRGEISCRIQKTCHRLGISTVAVYSDFDREAEHVLMANEAIYIGASPSSESYLNMSKIIEAVKQTKADAIHPGYGFLSENADFVQKCESAGIKFIGHGSTAMRSMGSKIEAKKKAKALGIPVAGSYVGDFKNQDLLLKEAKKITYPLLIKASSGGGGRGMRVVRAESELIEAAASAARESLAAFGRDDIFLEKYFENTRHIEIQILADEQGHVLSLFERECSAQRRHQKIIEESPSPLINEKQRKQLGAWATQLAKDIGYTNAGTVEFLYDVDSESFYFLEANTRLQVEHPVTESILGLDLVEQQIYIAEGKSLGLQQKDLKINGAAIECRLCAEDSMRDFGPSVGKILNLNFAQDYGARFDSGVTTGNSVGIYYDSLLAKIIVHAETRELATQKMISTLQLSRILGLTTNQTFLKSVLESAEFQSGTYDTKTVERVLQSKKSSSLQIVYEEASCAITLWRWKQRNLASKKLNFIEPGWRNHFYRATKEKYQWDETSVEISYQSLKLNQFEIKIDNQFYQSEILNISANSIEFRLNQKTLHYFIALSDGDIYVHNAEAGTLQGKLRPRITEAVAEEIKGSLHSTMPGKIAKILVKNGDQVKIGDPLIVVESMKMETQIRASTAGKIIEVFVKAGDLVTPQTQLIKIEELNDAVSERQASHD